MKIATIIEDELIKNRSFNKDLGNTQMVLSQTDNPDTMYCIQQTKFKKAAAAVEKKLLQFVVPDLSEVIHYEISSSIFFSLIWFDWGQNLVVKWVHWKTNRKYNRYIDFLKQIKLQNEGNKNSIKRQPNL